MNSDNIPCRIVGKHPHSGRRGEIEVVDGAVRFPKLAGVSTCDMFKVVFEDGDGCFATKRDVEILVNGLWRAYTR